MILPLILVFPGLGFESSCRHLYLETILEWWKNSLAEKDQQSYFFLKQAGQFLTIIVTLHLNFTNRHNSSSDQIDVKKQPRWTILCGKLVRFEQSLLWILTKNTHNLFLLHKLVRFIRVGTNLQKVIEPINRYGSP
jgi:hypothetical protein